MSTILKNILKQNGVETTDAPASTDADKSKTPPAQDAPEADKDKDKPKPVEDTKKEDKPAEQPNTETDIADDKLLAILQKKGHKIKSLDEISKPAETPLTEDQKKEAQKRKKDQARAFGLSTGKVSSTLLDEYARDVSMDKISLAFDLFRDQTIRELKAQGVSEDKLPDHNTLRKEFDDYNFLNADEDDPKRIRRERELEATADNYISSTYGDVLALDELYENHEKENTSRGDWNSLVEGVASDYTTNDTVNFEISAGTEKRDEKVSYPVKWTAAEIEKGKKHFLADEQFKLLRQSGLDKKTLAKAFNSYMILANLDRVIAEVANAHASAKIDAQKKGRRNALESTEQSQEQKSGGNKNPNMQRILEENKKAS